MSIIVSLTSTSARLPILRYSLTSIIDQQTPADRIVLNLSKDNYLVDEGIQKLPKWLKQFSDKGDIEIAWVENTGSYRKLIPIYQASCDQDLIITCDDDVIYGPEWLASLLAAAEKHPNSIICGRARVPIKLIGKRYQSYSNWPLAVPGARGHDLVPTGVAGVLYKKPLLSQKIMQSSDYKQLAPKQDDLWFKLAHEMLNVEVVVAEETYKHIFLIEGAPGDLMTGNASVKVPGWDKFISALSARAKLQAKIYMGFSTCDNDKVIHRLASYKSKLQTTAI